MTRIPSNGDTSTTRVPPASHIVGLDVGSTTVKAVVVDSSAERIVWRDYQRHETRQPEMVLEFLGRIMAELGLEHTDLRVFITGSGGAALAPLLGAKYVQEVNAVCLAVEALHPEAGSVIELGGQDAKIIIFTDDEETGRKKKYPSMNDKCAGGTGAVIDKINAKLNIPAEQLCNQGYDGITLHPVAGKCGVFAETDINGLQKQGVPPDELMASLFESIVQQNLSVLTRGHTLRPRVLLLGGPNTFIRGMVECWKENIPQIWRERDVPLPAGIPPSDLITVPEHAQYFAAVGAAQFGTTEDSAVGAFPGLTALEQFIRHGREEQKRRLGLPGLCEDAADLRRFREQYETKPFSPRILEPGSVFRAFLGIDGGSTSTKGVLLDETKSVSFKAYQLSRGNPIEDTIQIIGELHRMVEQQGCTLEILAVGTTGYAKDVLKDTISADVALVETVAHTQAALHFYTNVDVICDVGGQDIKLIILKNERVVDFKLNTQCSAGNGYFLQNTAESFGFTVGQYADIAFTARTMPEFGYGCAVFMQSDIIDFQRQGWTAGEIMAGLASVLPKNIWLYVSQIPNLAKLGTRFVLQGGTQHNLAAVKAQVDFIRSRFEGKNVEPTIIVHEHTGEAGAIGCAVEAARLYQHGRRTSFIGLRAVAGIQYRSTRNEDTRCYFCKNKCLRTFIDVETSDRPHAGTDSFEYKQGAEAVRAARFESEEEQKRVRQSMVPMPRNANRLIIATCEKGTVEDVDDMRIIAKNISENRRQFPNLMEQSARAAWMSWNPEPVPPVRRRPRLFAQAGHSGVVAGQSRIVAGHSGIVPREGRGDIVLGVPRTLNLYGHAPFFTAYFESLGIPFRNIIFSDFTSDELYREGSRRGSIDPCFPSKVSLAHVHDLLFRKHAVTPLSWIFFPMLDDLPSELRDTIDSKACPTAVGTVQTVKAAFTKEGDLFRQLGVRFLDPFINLNNRELATHQLFTFFSQHIELDREENRFAVSQAYAALERFTAAMRSDAASLLRRLEEEHGLGIVVLGRPYHADPGINHRILEEFQKLGYPIFSQDALPTDAATLDAVFGGDVRAGRIRHAMDIGDVWKNSYSENTNRKIWAAKFVARHPNLVALELSSFKCGHDAPVYSLIQEIVECSGTPYFSFKDIDENKPGGSIKIRVETIGYFLHRTREDMQTAERTREAIDVRVEAYEARLRHAMLHPASSRYSLSLDTAPDQAAPDSRNGRLVRRG